MSITEYSDLEWTFHYLFEDDILKGESTSLAIHIRQFILGVFNLGKNNFEIPEVDGIEAWIEELETLREGLTRIPNDIYNELIIYNTPHELLQYIQVSVFDEIMYSTDITELDLNVLQVLLSYNIIDEFYFVYNPEFKILLEANDLENLRRLLGILENNHSIREEGLPLFTKVLVQHILELYYREQLLLEENKAFIQFVIISFPINLPVFETTILNTDPNLFEIVQAYILEPEVLKTIQQRAMAAHVVYNALEAKKAGNLAKYFNLIRNAIKLTGNNGLDRLKFLFSIIEINE